MNPFSKHALSEIDIANTVSSRSKTLRFSVGAGLKQEGWACMYTTVTTPSRRCRVEKPERRPSLTETLDLLGGCVNCSICPAGPNEMSSIALEGLVATQADESNVQKQDSR